MYPILFMDCLVVKVRDNGMVDAQTDLLCLKDAITNVLNYAYSHHILLMVEF
ncbi:MAG: hypothetical protein WCP16_12625 [Pseudanabaena sp. ELA645]